jgi:hypothetical protein
MLCKKQVFIVRIIGKRYVVWQNTDFLLSEQVVHTVPTELENFELLWVDG